MRRRGSVLPVLSLLLCTAVAWLYFTPYVTLWRLEAAAKRGDAAALERMVDFPALRSSIKENVRADVSRRISPERGNPLAAIGGIVAGALADPVVDLAVTPDGIAALTRGNTPEEIARDRRGGERTDAGVRVGRGYEGFSTFTVRFHDRENGGEHLALLLRRDGLAGWKLERVRFGRGAGN
jgi:hypothetical protein